MRRLVPGLFATAPEPLSFAPSLEVRSFLLRRDEGNLLLYGAPGLAEEAGSIEGLGGVDRQYLNHWHEAMFGPDGLPAPPFVHAADESEVAERSPIGARSPPARRSGRTSS